MPVADQLSGLPARFPARLPALTALTERSPSHAFSPADIPASGSEDGQERGRDFGAADAPPSISPTDFARDVLRVKLWEKQEEVLSALPVHRRVAVKSGNGLGKGFSAAIAVLWFLHTHNPAIVLSTAPTFRQVRHLLWRQIHSLYRRAPEVLQGNLLDTRWELGEDRYAMGLSADGADQFQGFHCPNMLIVVDEAEGVSDAIYEGIESVMTSAEPRLLLLGNPTTASGVFRQAFYQQRGIYHCITISALDSPNVKAGKVIFPGLTTAHWVAERQEIWGKESPLYLARVLGQFADQAPDTLIRLSDVEAAAARWPREEATGETAKKSANGDDPELPGEVALAVDVARFGSDRSVILRRRGTRVEEIRTFNGMDTMELAGWVAAAIREFQPTQTCIDEIGVGAGVVDRLREQGYGVRGVNVARPAHQKEIFANLRAEGYWRLRELFAAGDIAIPQDQQLLGELASLSYGYDSRGRILMESKDELRRRGLPSPDKADALMLSFLIPLARPQIWV